MSAIQTRQRLHYFDMLKGIAIFMVVMGHVITFCIRGIDRAFLFKFVENVHMPLFFFISGWMTWKASGGWGSLGRRALQLLVPMLAVSTLWIFYFPHSGLQSPLDSTFAGLWGSMWKNGYWFTLVLFEIMCVYALCRQQFVRNGSACSDIAVFAAAVVILVYTVSFLKDKMPDVADAASLTLLSTFFPVFVAGVLANKHKENFNRICKSSAAVTLSLVIGSVALYVLSWPWEFPWLGMFSETMLRIVLHISLAVVAIAVVKPWSDEAFGTDAPARGRLFARAWTYVGRESLAIYLLHYFFLFPMGCMAEPMGMLNVAFVPMLVLSSVVASCIIGVVLAVVRILRPSALLSWLLCGRVPEYLSKQKKISTKQI